MGLQKICHGRRKHLRQNRQIIITPLAYGNELPFPPNYHQRVNKEEYISMETIIYQEEKRLWAQDWLNQKKDRHSRFMAIARRKYPIKPFLVQIALTIVLPLQSLTNSFA